jgi:hypothetical protein
MRFSPSFDKFSSAGADEAESEGRAASWSLGESDSGGQRLTRRLSTESEITALMSRLTV